MPLYACVEQTASQVNKCERDEIIDRLRCLVRRYEQGLYTEPKANFKSEKCTCGRNKEEEYDPRDYHETVTLDGREGKPVYHGSKKNAKKWMPPLKTGYQEGGPSGRCCCSTKPASCFQCTVCPTCGAMHYIPERDSRRNSPSRLNYNPCSSRMASNTRRRKPYVGSCRWPEACSASCFDHSEKPC